MSYTPEEQHLEPSIDILLDGIEKFEKAAGERATNSNEWNNVHIAELSDLRKKLHDIKLRLETIKVNTV